MGEGGRRKGQGTGGKEEDGVIKTRVTLCIQDIGNSWVTGVEDFRVG